MRLGPSNAWQSVYVAVYLIKYTVKTIDNTLTHQLPSIALSIKHSSQQLSGDNIVASAKMSLINSY
ncbi:hypothetical protein L2735_06580 [Shewanella olleyana]|uniref:hypothetical protein n=1 Tax=Shewanella olleyana TaxID=135626 RepID=UPI00200C7B3A|nr:hypothetical protein [Shewanella olleyana]MCL1066474.1 hypothetical protein [Shewanella olleyana]